MEQITVSAADRVLLGRFYDELYLPAFAHQREPLAAWLAHLEPGVAPPYQRWIVLAGSGLADPARARIDAGVIYERYPRSACGLVTYLVVAPTAQRGGLGRAMFDHACGELAARRVRAIFGEVVDPARDASAEARARMARFGRWGGRVVGHPYVQPALGAGLVRDRALALVAFRAQDAPAMAGEILASFLREFYAVVESIDAAIDPELGPILSAIPARVPLTPTPR